MGLENDLFCFLKIPRFYLLQDGYMYMYVCMHVCMHACMHACMHSCMHVWMSTVLEYGPWTLRNLCWGVPSSGFRQQGSARSDAFYRPRGPKPWRPPTWLVAETWISQAPSTSKYPIFGDSGSKNHALNGMWDQSPSILGTWTLWAKRPGEEP